MHELASQSLSTLRHSTAHILAQAVKVFFPEAKLGIGPSINDGFYYDFDIQETLNEDDLIKIEKEMQRIIDENQTFRQFNLSYEET